MSKFKFNYKDEKDLTAAPGLLKAGLGSFRVAKILTTDKEGLPLVSKAGDDKVIVIVVATDSQGDESSIYEHITPNTTWKIYTLCKAVGRKDLYTEDGVDFDELVGLCGECMLKVSSSPGYNDRTEIASYIDPEKEKPKPKKVMVTDADMGDPEEIPF